TRISDSTRPRTCPPRRRWCSSRPPRCSWGWQRSGSAGATWPRLEEAVRGPRAAPREQSAVLGCRLRTDTRASSPRAPPDPSSPSEHSNPSNLRVLLGTGEIAEGAGAAERIGPVRHSEFAVEGRQPILHRTGDLVKLDCDLGHG